MTGSDCDSDSSEVLSVGHEPGLLDDLSGQEAAGEDSSNISSINNCRAGGPHSNNTPTTASTALASSRSPSPASSVFSIAEQPPEAPAQRLLPAMPPLVQYPSSLQQLAPSLSLSPPTIAPIHPAVRLLALQPLHQIHAAAMQPLVPSRILLPPSPDSSSLSSSNARDNERNNNTNASNNNNSAVATNGVARSPSAAGNDNGMQLQGNLKFSIDNILKADFGRRITDPLALKRSRANKRPSTALPIDLTKDLAESSSEGSDRGSEASTRNTSPGLSLAPSPGIKTSPSSGSDSNKLALQWPAWVYCTRYSDRPSSGRSPRSRRPKRSASDAVVPNIVPDEKRPRTAFSAEQLARLKREFNDNKYLNESRRQLLSKELGLNEAQIKIWFQNKRAKNKKASGKINPLAEHLKAQGLYNHATIHLSKEELELSDRVEERKLKN